MSLDATGAALLQVRLEPLQRAAGSVERPEGWRCTSWMEESDGATAPQMHKRMPYKCLQSEQVRRTYGGVRKALWTGRYRRTVANKISTQELEAGSTEYNDR